MFVENINAFAQLLSNIILPITSVTALIKWYIHTSSPIKIINIHYYGLVDLMESSILKSITYGDIDENNVVKSFHAGTFISIFIKNRTAGKYHINSITLGYEKINNSNIPTKRQINEELTIKNLNASYNSALPDGFENDISFSILPYQNQWLNIPYNVTVLHPATKLSNQSELKLLDQNKEEEKIKKAVIKYYRQWFNESKANNNSRFGNFKYFNINTSVKNFQIKITNTILSKLQDDVKYIENFDRNLTENG
jgi:hypothetical protein